MFSKKIKELQSQIEAKLGEVEALQTAVEAENRGFSDDESEQRTALIADIKSLKGRKNSMEETEALMADNKAAPVAGTPAPTAAPAEPAPQRPAATGKDLKVEGDPSLFFAKQAHALFMCGGSRVAASEYAKDTMQDDMLAKVFKTPAKLVEKATVLPGTSTTTNWAAELVQVNQAASAFIDLLRPMSVVVRFPGTQMSFEGAGSIKIPRKTGGSTGTWVGENKAIKVDSLALDEITLSPNKNANIITITNELMMRSEPSAMALVRDDILIGIAESIDTKFVSDEAASAGVSPAGIQTFDSSSTVSTGDTLDQITADLKAAIGAMLALNMPMTRPVWLINPLRLNSLRFIRDGLGSYAFKDEIASGMLMGYPFLESNTQSSSVVTLVDASQIVIASDLAPVIDVSEDASLHMVDSSVADDIGGATTPVQSMFQMDGVAIRAKTTIDWEARHDDCSQVITSVSW